MRYDGTDYHGFQKQAQAPTIQAALEDVLTSLFGPGRVRGASRTDAGVHAEGQVAVWDGAVPLPLSRVALVVNRRLPPAVQIVAADWVPAGWNPQKMAVAKQYSYRIWRADGSPSLPWYRVTHAVPGPMSWRRLNEAAGLFLGTHDFSAFRTEGSSAQTTVRCVWVSRWIMEQGGSIWRYQVVGNGFLYRMVRHMVGAMLKAAEPGGDVLPIADGLAHPDRKVGALAPACGLTLDWISFVHKQG